MTEISEAAKAKARDIITAAAVVAEEMFLVADAMLAEREKRNG